MAKKTKSGKTVSKKKTTKAVKGKVLRKKSSTKPVKKKETMIKKKAKKTPVKKVAAKTSVKKVSAKKTVSKKTAEKKAKVPKIKAVKVKEKVVELPKVRIEDIKGYSRKDLDHFKQIILEKRDEIIEQLQNLKDQMLDPTTGEDINENSPYSLHMAEQGTDAMEREKTFLYAQRENKFLGYLEDALKELKPGLMVFASNA